MEKQPTEQKDTVKPYTVRDCGDYWRIAWDDNSITTTSKRGMRTKAEVESWLQYLIRG